MARLKLTEAQEEQIRAMAKEGKRNKEIIDFFKATYHIALNSSRVCYVCYGREGKGKKQGGVASRAIARTEQKRLTKKTSQDSEDVNIQELVTLLTQIDAGYKKLLEHFRGTLKQLRSELIKSRGQVQEMLKGAGIEVEEN